MVKHFFQKLPRIFLPGQFSSTLFAFICRYIFRSSHPSSTGRTGFLQWLDVGQKLVFADPAVQVTDLLEARNLAVLMRLDGFYEVGCLYQTLMCTGIQPGEALSEKLNVQAAVFQIDPVQVGDLKLSAR